MRSHKQGKLFKSNIYTSTTDSKVSELPLTHHHPSSIYQTMMPTQLEDTSSRHINDINGINELQGKTIKNYHDMSANTFVKSMNAILLDNGKHPVNKVNEIMELLNKNKVEYSYLEVNEKLEDAQNFNCIAKSKSINAYGTGVSKKDAKKNAAIDFINKLQSNFLNFFYEEEQIWLDEQKVNYVGVLQNFCMAVPSQLPEYECVKDDENQNNMFTVKCHLYGYTTKGKGKSKQTAKKKAAFLMYNQIKDIPRDRIVKDYVNEWKIPSVVSEEINDSANHTSMQPRKVSEEKNDSINQTLMQPSSNIQKYCNSKNYTITEDNNSENSIMMKSKDSVINNLDSFFDHIKSSKKPTLSRLREIKRIQLCAMDTIQMLYDIGNEENFTVNYESIPNQLSSAVKVKVNLSVSPTLIHMGNGTTAINAFREASFNVLVYLKKIMNGSKP